MLIRSTWTLTVSEPVFLPRAYSLELVKDLHRRMQISFADIKIPAVTYSGIIGSCSTSGDFITFSPNNFYKLSLCGLQDMTAKVISNLDLSPYFEFLGTKFDVVNRQNETTSYEHLYHTLVASEPEPIKRFYLDFITPTVFAQQRTRLALPVPYLMFRSWLERWNHFAPVYLGSDELMTFLSDVITLRKHKIQTRIFKLANGFVNGFTGNVTLQVLHGTEPLLANVANLLVNYAQFTGTGMKTRLGMGLTNINLMY
ncbi:MULTISPECIES: CRISPR system precrRNA processing endoribonuclease RAMP protein Cas6 [Nostocales]|uniref:CRISPR system precrRNA processing endoribonuclease RAMP protein Cas6 n=3 Tax=Nostocales TaxID=1161 RepID=A0A0C1NH10_9CYAN|nr:CRISPR system precrRNA processing endoribonuclease RAMP protein Cas6 [Tolypothrix bouteillei]KAF3890571.1 CRISPR system precrRNA processing endoribonuclease RAMP protein Cas6 [Tolypothrix bouteillei VB521301]